MYFANSGLRTRLNLLNTFRAWWTLAVLILLASVAKIVPVSIATKVFTGKSWFYSTSMGVLMNTRGIVQLVVLNIGVQLGVISPVIFAMFVLMATVLTFLTSPILSVLYSRVNESDPSPSSSSPGDGEKNERGEKISTISSPSSSLPSYRDPSKDNADQSKETLPNEKKHRRMTLF